MSIHQGSKIVTRGLVFAYDMPDRGTDYSSKSWKGRPLTNSYQDLFTSQSMRTHTKHYWDGNRWVINSTYTHPGYPGPKGVFLGKVAKHVSGAFNSSWSGNSYGYMLRDISGQTNGAYYTQSCWVYVSQNSNLTAVPSVIEGESSGEATASTGEPTQYNMSNKGTWQRIAKRAISDGNTRFIPVYPRRNGVTDGSFTGAMLWGGVQVEDGSNVSQLVDAGDGVATRSNTQALLDWTGNQTITANATYNSDGTFKLNSSNPDYLDLGSDKTIKTSGGWTVESWVKYDTVPGGYDNVNSPGNFIGSDSISYNSWYWSVLNSKLALWNLSPGTWRYGSTTLQANTWYHAVLVCAPSGTSYQMYLNGVAEGGDHTTYTSWSSSHSGLKVRYMGRGNSGNTRRLNGSLPTTRIYDRPLSAEEVLNNYNAHKDRFV